ncbi:hypothetical protein HNE05_10690 [Aquipseudomonas campi]|uniref:Uracil-DNA glycosylase-like domain-containing protein n=1 Tax=Aquipseudomonas campi TaxID=2731681 RepID=A0A6M8F5E9_9GAMM|nr:hypothetical protein [Pseudomonas campi]QKE63804.1 hypothetical protein HNE05_10690 [Pseudomonas campi]
MPNLAEFQQRLETIIGRPADQRPFVCDGSPLDCRVFIVGLNPASASERDFWEFWDCEAGFNKRAWFESYLTERAKRPLKPGKTRRNPISNTRRVLEWVISSAGDTRILETNIYASATEDAKGLAGSMRCSRAFDFLVDALKPRLVVAHGNHAVDHMRTKYPGLQTIAVKHFSRGWSQQAAWDLGLSITREARTF